MARIVHIAVTLVALLAVSVAPARAQDEEVAAQRAAALAAVQKLLAAGDTFAAAEHVQAEGTPLEVAGRYGAVVGGLYWKAKDLPGCVAMGRAATLYCLTKSRETGDDSETARRLRVTAQRLSFDLASFAWPGWDEKGIVIGAAELAAGLDFARLDLRLVQEMEYPPEKHANAHWIVGAQLLAAKRYDEARAAFLTSREKAREAEDAEKEWMAHGYAAIAARLAQPDDAKAKSAFDEAVAKLEALGTDDGSYLATQVRDVLKVFSR